MDGFNFFINLYHTTKHHIMGIITKARAVYCSLFLLTASLFFLSSCSSVPKHASLIPKDAVFVAGINTGELGKKVAWNALTGSDLFKQMKERMPNKQAVDNLAEAGIEVMSTSYIYMPTAALNTPGTQPAIVALIPLDDVKKWEAYVNKNFPAANIASANGRKEGLLAEGMHAGWDKDVLVLTNSAQAPTISYAFGVKKDASLISDKRFKELESSGHDITLWLNYEGFMAQSMQAMQGMGAAAGMQFGSALWKGAAFTSGFDFEKGKITGDSKYYVSETLKEASKEWKNDNPSKDMLDRLPGGNLDMIAAMHLPPQYLKVMLEKAGLLGFVSLGLAQTNITTDDLFGAFTGDMAVTINDLSIKYQPAALAGTDSSIVTGNKPATDMNVLFVMGIGDEAKFNKLLSYTVSSGAMQAAGTNTWTMGAGAADAVTIQRDGKYAVVSNKAGNTQSFLSGANKSSAMPESIKGELSKHPLTFFVDFQHMLASMQPNPADQQGTAAMTEVRRLMKDMTMKGGEWKSDAFVYDMELSFLNKEENALIVLLDFASRMKGIMDLPGDTPAYEPEMYEEDTTEVMPMDTNMAL